VRALFLAKSAHVLIFILLEKQRANGARGATGPTRPPGCAVAPPAHPVFHPTAHPFRHARMRALFLAKGAHVLIFILLEKQRANGARGATGVRPVGNRV